MRHVRFAFVSVLLAAGVLSGCVRHEQTTTTVRARPEHVANPSQFPAFPNSTIVDTVPVNSAHMFAAIKSSNPDADLPKSFRGFEVIAETSASMAQLRVWLHALRSSPPQGLHAVVNSRDRLDIGNDAATAVGAQFETAGGGRWVYVVAADPKRLHDQLGPLFTLIENYNAVPGVLRGPIDEQSKKQVGYSVSELLDPKSPVGAVIGDIKRIQADGRRGILILDGTQAR